MKIEEALVGVLNRLADGFDKFNQLQEARDEEMKKHFESSRVYNQKVQKSIKQKQLKAKTNGKAN